MLSLMNYVFKAHGTFYARFIRANADNFYIDGINLKHKFVIFTFFDEILREY